MRVVTLAAVLLLTAQSVFAQSGWQDRIRVSVSAGLQPDAGALAEEFTLTENFEPTPIAANAPATNLPFVDAGVLVRMLGNLAVGAAISSLSTQVDPVISASIPHPFFFNRPRPIEGRALGFSRNELGLHANVAYVVDLPGGIAVTPQGGATLFRVSQDLVSNVHWDDEYPFDTAAFASATKTRAQASKLGYNAAVDVSWMASRHLGVGGLIRYSDAKVPLDIDGERAATIDAGGLQAAGGVRLAF